MRWSEVDPQGIVFNPVYFTYADVAVTEYWREIGFPYPDALPALGLDALAVRATAEFRASARFDDELDILARTARIGVSSMRLLFEIHRTEDLLVAGELVYVLVGQADRRPAAVPEPIRRAVDGYEKVPPEG